MAPAREIVETGGRVLSDYLGSKRPYAKQIRREQSVVLSADRSPKVAGIGAPISGADGTIIAALTCSMPTERLDKSFEPFVKKAARDLTTLIGHSYPEPEK